MFTLILNKKTKNLEYGILGYKKITILMQFDWETGRGKNKKHRPYFLANADGFLTVLAVDDLIHDLEFYKWAR